MAERICPRCGDPVPPSLGPGRPRTYCSTACQVKASRTPAVPRTIECAGCHRAFECKGGPGRRLCGDCQRFGTVARAARPSTEHYVCGNCGREVERPLTKGQRPKWCDACRAIHVGRDPAVKKFNDHRRRQRVRAATVETFTDAEIFDRDRWRCGICGRKVDRRLKYPHSKSASLDHVVPLSQDGLHERTNVRCAHLDCNVRRGNRGGDEQLRLIG